MVGKNFRDEHDRPCGSRVAIPTLARDVAVPHTRLPEEQTRRPDTLPYTNTQIRRLSPIVSNSVHMRLAQ